MYPIWKFENPISKFGYGSPVRDNTFIFFLKKKAEIDECSIIGGICVSIWK
jgi:hypothetical protein